MNIKAKNEEEFFALSGQYEPIMRELDALIRATSPALKPQFVSGMSMTMLGYGVVPYKYASGRSGEWPLVAIAPQKNYGALYICATTDGEYYAEKYKDRLGKVSCGRSCIRFKKPEDINLSTVAEIVKEVETRYKNGDTLFGI